MVWKIIFVSEERNNAFLAKLCSALPYINREKKKKNSHLRLLFYSDAIAVKSKGDHGLKRLTVDFRQLETSCKISHLVKPSLLWLTNLRWFTSSLNKFKCTYSTYSCNLLRKKRMWRCKQLPDGRHKGNSQLDGKWKDKKICPVLWILRRKFSCSLVKLRFEWNWARLMNQFNM